MDLTKYYVLYDGDCGLCNFWVQWILKKDQKNRFLFSALQSDFSQAFLKERGLNSDEQSTLYLWKPSEFYHTKSSAVLEIAKILGGSYALLAKINFLPRSFTDIFYDKIAKNRKTLSGEHCVVPTSEQRKKFID